MTYFEKDNRSFWDRGAEFWSRLLLAKYLDAILLAQSINMATHITFIVETVSVTFVRMKNI